MSRTNGDTARTVRARGGYDAYFTQQAVAPGGGESASSGDTAASPSGPADGQAQQTFPGLDNVTTRKVQRPWPTQAQQAGSRRDAQEPGSTAAQPGSEASQSREPTEPSSTAAASGGPVTAQIGDAAAQSFATVEPNPSSGAAGSAGAHVPPVAAQSSDESTKYEGDPGSISGNTGATSAQFGTAAAQRVPGPSGVGVDPANLGSVPPHGNHGGQNGLNLPPNGQVSVPDAGFTLSHNGFPSAAEPTPQADPRMASTPAGEHTATQPEVEVSYQPNAAALARREATGQHATQTSGTHWAATPPANPWGHGPAAYAGQPAYHPQPAYTPQPYTTAQPEVQRAEVMPATLSSQDLLSQIAAMKQAKLRSNAGMRGALNKVGFNLGLSSAERRFEDRRARIRRQLSRTYQIAVLSVKGGVGRTTITAALGSTFAHLRPDRVVAVDANPDFGDLATRTSRHPYGLTLRDLAYAQNLEAFSTVHSFTAINSADLAVVASPWTTESVEALSGPEFAAATDILRRHYNLMLVDCGTGVLTSATSTVMQSSDSAVIVTPATVGGVKGAVATLNWLNMHGFTHLVENSIVVIVHQRPDKPIVEVAEIEKLFATVSRPTCEVPYDQHLAEGGEIDLRLVAKDTAVVFEELAAALADNFPGFPDARHDLGGYR